MTSHPILICPTHGNQGARISCKWCSHDIFTEINRPVGNSSLEPGVLRRAVQAPSFPLDVVHDQFQIVGDGLE